MNVTIIADASHCPNTRVAGYGYWIASNRGDLGGSGRMRGRIETNVVAEMMAVANSLYHAVQAQLVWPEDSVLMQTDCLAAITALEGSRKNLIAQELSVVQLVDNFVGEYLLTVRYRHVKGHSRAPGARFVANHMCDMRAKAAMRSMRDQILAKT